MQSGQVIRATKNLQIGHLNNVFDFRYKYWGKVKLLGSLSYPNNKNFRPNNLLYSTKAADLNHTIIIVSTKHTKFTKNSKSPINIYNLII
jgi:hypothetical protein